MIDAFQKRLKASKPRTYELWAIGSAKDVVEFEACQKDLVAATVGNAFTKEYVYYKRYSGNKFYRLRREELAFMQLSGEEIPF